MEMKISGRAPCEAATVENDPWVPLKIRWDVQQGAQPVYLFASGVSGGYAEIKIDPATGAFISLTVIDEPPLAEGGFGEVSSGGSDPSVPLVDLSRLGGAGSGDIARIDCQMSWSRSVESFTLRFARGIPHAVIGCGSVLVFVDSEGRLLEVSASAGEQE
ncbi:hypothetical protein ABZ946_28100 [Streptomyces sp. NPDC046324]|uniref:hypothetical protein n=1 Tax=Streptomyces sp. NPDC046324 TaxID=3154915 RepID=UPI0033C0B880